MRPGFAGAVSHARTGHVAAGNGGGVADGAARGLERGRGRAGAPEGAEQVGGEDGGPEIVGEPIKLARRDRLHGGRGAGIVDEEIEPAEGIDGVAHHFLGAPRLRDVARRADHRKALRAQSLDRRRAARIVRQMVERHGGAAAGEQFDRRQPDAGGRAGDQRRLAREVSHVALERSGDYICRALELSATPKSITGPSIAAARAIVEDRFARTLPGETIAHRWAGSPPHFTE